MQVGLQATVGAVWRGVRQGHAGQRIQLTEAGAGQTQAQIQSAQILRISQAAGQHDTGRANAHIGLQRERLRRVMQRQQATDLAAAGQRLATETALGLPGESVILGAGIALGQALGRALADDIGEWNRLAQRLDNCLQAGIADLVVDLHPPLVEADGADIQRPGAGLLAVVRLFLAQIEHPVGPAIGQALQIGDRRAEFDTGNAHRFPQQRQGRQAQTHAVETDEGIALRPVRVAQAQLLGSKMGPG